MSVPTAAAHFPAKTPPRSTALRRICAATLAVYSFGQTFKTTAIQQLRAISAVANGGYLVTPHLLKQVVDNNGNVIYENTTEKVKILDETVCNTISEILKEGVDGSGGAKNAYVAGYSVAAKTGTSEKKDKYDANGNTSYRVSSCVAYAPSDNPQVAIILMIDEPSVGSAYGSVVAAPYISSLLELILPYLGIEADYDELDKEHELVSVSNVLNKDVDSAIEELKKAGISYELVGNGDTVVSQMPQAGSKIFKNNGKIILYTDSSIESYSVVPNVIGKTAEEATEILLNAGFNIKISGALNYKKGQGARITTQYPQSDTVLKRGDIVTVEILFDEDKD